MCRNGGLGADAVIRAYQQAKAPTPLCPSASPAQDGCRAIAVVGDAPGEPRLRYFTKPLGVDTELLALTGPVDPTAVLRFAAPCAENACQHFDGADCRLVQKMVTLLPPAVERLPPCPIRPQCRWWLQEGRDACRRCPEVLSLRQRLSELQARVADPTYPLPASA